MNDLHPVTSPYLKNINPVAETQSRDLKIMKELLSIKHRIETIERIDYEGLPLELNKDLIERILYYRFKGALFFYKPLEKFYFLPFTLKGDIDSYGRYIEITPTLFTGQWESNNEDNMDFMSDVKYKVAYDKTLPLDGNYAIILNDHSLAVSQDEQPMSRMIQPIIDQMVDILVLINIDLVSSAKVFYVRVNSPDEKALVEREFHGLDDKILSGQRVVAVVGDMAWQELQAKSPKDSSRYFQTYQSFDNLRKDIIGVPNGGTFMKQEHMTDQETDLNSNAASYVLKNAVRMRSEWAELCNHYYGLNIVVKESQVESNDVVAEKGQHTKNQDGDNDALQE